MTSHLTKTERNRLLIGVFLSTFITTWVTMNSVVEATLSGFLGV